MRDASYLLWHSIMNTYQIGSHEREPNQYVLIHNRFLGDEDDIFLVDKARLPGVVDISISQEIDSPAHSFSVTCENKDGLLSPDYYLGKTPYDEAFRGHLNSVWKGQLKPNTKLEIHLGYGEQIVRVMTGLIDDVIVSAETQTITITGRSMYKRIVDNTITPYKDDKYIFPSGNMTITDAINRAFVYANVDFEGIPIVDKETSETYLIEEPRGVRGETYQEVIEPLVNSAFHYFYELPTGKVEQREIPKFSKDTEPVFTVDDKMHLTGLEYKYDDTDVFGTVIVEANGMSSSFSSDFIANTILGGERKELVVGYPWAKNSRKRRRAAQYEFTRMLHNLRTVSVSLPANPLLELYDPIRIQEKISTVSRNYHIRAIDYSFNASGFIQTLECSINSGFYPPEKENDEKPIPNPPGSVLPPLTTKSKVIVVGVWDHSAVDGDILTVKLNDEVVEADIFLEDEPYEVKMEIEPGRNVISFVGVSAGVSADLTASMWVKNEDGHFLSSEEYVISMPRDHNTPELSPGFYTGKKPVRNWVVNYV